MAIQNSGVLGDSFFKRSQKNPNTTFLITDQIDPSQPQIQGLQSISDPLIAAENTAAVVGNFDPDLYNLQPTSHLMRLLRALIGAAGIGGIRKQIFITRNGTSIGGTSFVDLDKFYGALFNFRRNGVELMPLKADGSTLNPLTDSASSSVWEDALSRDARYRSRIYQLARAINMGGSYAGLVAVAEAVLSSPVDLIESWVKVDATNNNNNLSLPTAKTFAQIGAQNVTWGNIHQSYNVLAGSTFGLGSTPDGNRGELIFTPRRQITPEEKYQLMQVLQVVKPSHTQVTIASMVNQAVTTIVPRSLAADSEYWSVQSRATLPIDLIQPLIPLYQNSGTYSTARPVFSEYEGQAWSYNANIVKTMSYRMDSDDLPTTQRDDETITYQDGQSHTYIVSDGIMDTHQSSSARLGDGVITSYPYSGNRTTYVSAL